MSYLCAAMGMNNPHPSRVEAPVSHVVGPLPPPRGSAVSPALQHPSPRASRSPSHSISMSMVHVADRPTLGAAASRLSQALVTRVVELVVGVAYSCPPP